MQEPRTPEPRTQLKICYAKLLCYACVSYSLYYRLTWVVMSFHWESIESPLSEVSWSLFLTSVLTSIIPYPHGPCEVVDLTYLSKPSDPSHPACPPNLPTIPPFSFIHPPHHLLLLQDLSVWSAVCGCADVCMCVCFSSFPSFRS